MFVSCKANIVDENLPLLKAFVLNKAISRGFQRIEPAPILFESSRGMRGRFFGLLERQGPGQR
jgi:hypothetical protein